MTTEQIAHEVAVKLAADAGITTIAGIAASINLDALENDIANWIASGDAQNLTADDVDDLVAQWKEWGG